MARIGPKAIQKSTGKKLSDWVDIIQRSGFSEASHKSIADFLHQKYQLSFWWAQEITVLFEKHIGKRVTGQTQNGRFQVGVSKTLAINSTLVWNFLVSPEFNQLITGDFTPQELNSAAEAINGIRYKTTTFQPFSHFRMQWKKREWDKYSVLQVRLTSKSDHKTTLTFHKENLPDQNQRKELKLFWSQILHEVEEKIL